MREREREKGNNLENYLYIIDTVDREIDRKRERDKDEEKKVENGRDRALLIFYHASIGGIRGNPYLY